MTVFNWILRNWGFCLFFIAAFVQFTPAIKLNPLGWLGDKLLGKLTKRIEGIERTVDENEKDRIRYEILDFANSCRNKRRHTKDEFDHIIILKAKYGKLLEKTNDSNGVFDAEYEYILELYRRCQRENSFL
jgi:hypothetical protein